MMLGFEFLLFPLVFLGVIVFGVLALVNVRREPDPTGRRLLAVYLTGVIFLTLFIVVFASFGVVSSLASAAFKDEPEHFFGGPGGFGSEEFGVAEECFTTPDGGTQCGPSSGSRTSPPVNNDNNEGYWRSAVQSALILIAAGIVLVPHWRRLKGLTSESDFDAGPAAGTYRTFLYVVCFISVVTALVAGATAAFGAFRAIAPGLASFTDVDFERSEGIVQLLGNAYLAGISLFLLRSAWPERTSLTESGT